MTENTNPFFDLPPSEQLARLRDAQRKIQSQLEGYFDLSTIARESHKRHLVHGTASPDSLTAIWGMVRHFDGIVSGLAEAAEAISAAVGRAEHHPQARPRIRLPLSTVEHEEWLFAAQVGMAEAESCDTVKPWTAPPPGNCPECDGSGETYDQPGASLDEETIDCPGCQGTGYVVGGPEDDEPKPKPEVAVIIDDQPQPDITVFVLDPDNPEQLGQIHTHLARILGEGDE